MVDKAVKDIVEAIRSALELEFGEEVSLYVRGKKNELVVQLVGKSAGILFILYCDMCSESPYQAFVSNPIVMKVIEEYLDNYLVCLRPIMGIPVSLN